MLVITSYSIHYTKLYDSIPYVEKFYLFEMPIEGIFGYLPYGIYNWVAWIGFAYLLNIKTIFDKE